MNKKIILLIVVIALVITASVLFLRQDEPSPVLAEPVNPQAIAMAVLPFTHPQPDQDLYSNGFTEDILVGLGRLKGVNVRAKTSSFLFQDKLTDLSAIGKKLNVQLILVGSMAKDGERIRITARLVDIDKNVVIWSDEYDGTIRDIEMVEGTLIDAVAHALKISLPEETSSGKSQQQITSVEAYELYLKGRELWDLRTPANLKNGIELFEQAIALSPDYAGAYAGIADCYIALGYGSHLPPSESFPKAFEAAKRALSIDSTLSAPHATLGYYQLYYEWDWAAAEQEFRTALALNPNDALAHAWYGYYLTAMRRYEEAALMLEKAAALDPLSHSILTDIGFSLYYSRQYDSADVYLNRALDLNNTFPLAHLWKGRVLQARAHFPEAIAEYNQMLTSTPEWPVALAQIGNVYGRAAMNVDATRILSTLMDLRDKKYVTSYGIALVYAGMNDNVNALVWLEKAYQERSHWLVWLKTDPRWDAIKDDPAFINLLNRIALPQ